MTGNFLKFTYNLVAYLNTRSSLYNGRLKLKIVNVNAAPAIPITSAILHERVFNYRLQNK